jgi:predicted RNA-binding protein YlxR (DUF448 family)
MTLGETIAGADRQEGEAELPERTCIVTREVKDPDELIRFVRAPSGEVVPDLRCKLPGRGVWVSCAASKVAEAARRKLFARGFRADCRAPADLGERTGLLLREEALACLSLANKAGLATAGFERVAELARKGRLAVLVEAADGAADGRRKLRGKLKEAGTSPEIIDVFESPELGLALGQSHVIHAAIAEGGLARKFLAAARRFAAYRER